VSRRWERGLLIALLAGTALLYLWDLGASGWANPFYAAAAQAGSTDPEAFFYGSSDAGNSITVDKPPASIWIMALSVRLFGLSPWSVLVPQALIGVASVLVLYLTLRRRFAAGTALLGGLVLALTPAAALMFRFDNPDALLVLLLTLATYFTVRGIEDGRLRWVLWAGTMVGLGFLTKQLQAFLLLPALAGVYLWAAPGRVARRVGYSFAALGAVLLSAGWWVAVVQLVPPAWRPYVGGSQSNSFLELTFGYNGFGRLSGWETGSVGGGHPGGWGYVGILRLVSGDTGGQIAWLLPAALILAAIGFVVLRRAPRTSVRRATLALFTGWLVITGLAFSFMAGIFHAYYTVALAPAIAGVVAIGAGRLWAHRAEVWARVAAAGVIVVTGLTGYLLLRLVSGWQPWLRVAVPVLALVAAALMLVPPRARVVATATAVAGVSSLLLAPAAYALQTAATPHSGSVVAAGPTVSVPSLRIPGAPHPPGPASVFAASSGGGLLDAGLVGDRLATVLARDAEDFTWVAATVGSQRAAGYQLATRLPVMPVGGFNGSDPSPTLEQFQSYVAEGRIHYFVAGALGRSNGGSSESSRIAAWVEAHFPRVQVDGIGLFDLTSEDAGSVAATPAALSVFGW
jgi:4-amino-4-deoxy-L-arabinose transferase-like glycosyltransferase